jgi:hypothetical protein
VLQAPAPDHSIGEGAAAQLALCLGQELERSPSGRMRVDEQKVGAA